MIKQLIILKIGGSVFACKESKVPRVDLDVLRRIAREIAVAYKRGVKLILVHGAGSYGHPIVKRTKIDKGIKNKKQLVAFAETQRLQNDLNSIVTKELIDLGVPAIPCQASASAIMSDGKIKKMFIEVEKGLVELGLVPTLYGVPAYDEKRGCSILSGDDIVPFLAKYLNAKKIIHGTDVDGVFTSDPKINPDAKLIEKITPKNFKSIEKGIRGSMKIDVTGGMRRKIEELLKLSEIGIESLIVNARKKDRIKKALLGEKVIGTTICKS
ncbi:MAG: isopentenyl phosphate kinase [Candidatus Parvarchaeota archaeon]|nr:isopentenyl phosphate kinase [Candidatus Jingweiarchaeum tengchongense]